MRIVALGYGFINWSGGRDFLQSCIKSLIAIYKRPLEIYLLVPYNARIPDIEMKATAEWIKNMTSIARVVGYSHSGNADIVYCLDRIKADVVIPSMQPLGKDFPYPWVGYIYDFQHEFCPELFSSKEIQTRQLLFDLMLSEANAIIVNSRAVKDDVYKYYPETACRVFSLPFSPILEMSWLEESGDISQKYSIPEKYFIICNQFWIHKDHITPIEALAILKEEGAAQIDIVCTGNTHDDRFPGYFDKLSEKIREYNLDNNIHILGYIPKADQIQLMRNAVAVIQPSLFEGGPGGGSVREALAVGIPAIVSDIPVNREIGDDKVTFFQTGSASDLAKKMDQALKINHAQRSEIATLLESGKVYEKAVGARLIEAIAYVLEAYCNGDYRDTEDIPTPT